MQRLRTFVLHFLRQNAGASLALLFLDLLANLLIVALSVTAAQVYTGLLGMGSARGRLLAEFGIGEGLTGRGWLWVFGGLVLLRAAADWGRRALRGRIGEDFSLALRKRLFAHQLHMERKHYTEKGAGRYLLRFSGDLNSVQSLFTKGILRTVGDVSLVVASLTVFFYLDAPLGTAVLGVLAILSAVLWGLNRAAGVVDGKRRNRKSGILAYVSRHLPFVAAVQATNRERPVREGFNRRAGRLAREGYRYWYRAAGVSAVVPLGIYGALWVVLYLLFNRGAVAANPSELLIFILLLLSWRPVLGRLLRVGLLWKKGLISGRKLANLFDRSVEQPVSLPDVRIDEPTLAAEELAFGYEDGELLFEGLDFTLRPGELRVFTAGCGGGKTSLARLLAGCERPTAGRLLQGGHDLTTTDRKSWRRNLAFISPAFPLFGATLGESLRYSRRGKYKRATAELFAEWQTLFPILRPLHLRQRLTSHGGKLTGGQTTLLLWLRALLANKPLLIVDEGLRGLDAPSRATLLAWLRGRRHGYGILWLSHHAGELPDDFGALPLAGHQLVP